MQTRPFGSDASGLCYSPLLQDAHIQEAQAARKSGPVRRQAAHQLLDLWRATVAIARRAGRRLIEARMEQARRQLDLAVIRYRIDTPAEGRGPAARYY